MRLRDLVSLTAVAVVGTAALTTAPADAAPKRHYTTISSHSAADPGFSKFGSYYYVYATGGKDAHGHSDGVLPIFRGTSTKARFTQVGNAYKKAPKGYSGIWAPHVVKRGSYYFMFFTASKNGHAHCVYWAESAHATGGFHGPHLLTCGSGWEAIDPSVYGNYVVWKRGHYTGSGFPHGDFEIRARKLTFSGAKTGFAAHTSSSIVAKAYNTTVMEAPSVIAHGGKVWLFVSRDRFDDNDYHTDAWVAPRFGVRFHYSNHVMATGQGYGSGPGGAEVLADSHGVTRIAYHVWDRNKPTPKSPGVRITRLSTISWKGGIPHVN